MDRFNRLSDEIVRLPKEKVPAESEQCQTSCTRILELDHGVYKWRFDYASEVDGSR